MEIYIINMDNATERLAFQKEQMKRLGLGFNRVPAIPFNALPKDFIQHCKKTWIDMIEVPPWCISLLFNHKTIWEKIFQTSKPALILEDDAILTDDVPEILKQLESNKIHADSINLESINANNLLAKKVNNFYKHYYLIRNYRQKVTSAGYILYPSGAKILIDSLRKYTGPSDAYINSPLIRLARWIIDPTPIYQSADFYKPTLYPRILFNEPQYLGIRYRRLLSNIARQIIYLRYMFKSEKRHPLMTKEAKVSQLLTNKMTLQHMGAKSRR